MNLSTITKAILLPLALSCLMQPLLTAQDGEPEPARISMDELELQHFKPEHTNVESLYSTASSLFGRSLAVGKRDGRNGARISNMQLLGKSIVLLEEPTRVERLLERLYALDSAGKEDARAGSSDDFALQNFQYQPRHIPLRQALEALRPYQRMVLQPGRPTPGYGQQPTDNISASEALKTLVIRDSAENIAEIKALLASIDRPSPQFMLSALVIEGRQDPKASHEVAAPGELVEHLSQLLPYEHFVTLSTGLVQTSMNAQSIELKMPADANAGSELRIAPIAFNPDDGSLTAHFDFQVRDGRSFSTTASLPTGEYTVLGASGARPVFLVLRLAPLGSPTGDAAGSNRFGPR